MTEDPPPDLVFYHTVEYAPGRKTAGWPVVLPIVEMIMQAMRQVEFRGRRALDIGCMDGAIAFEAEKLGAAEVIAIDYDLKVATTTFLKRVLGSQVRFEQCSLYELTPARHGMFDIIVMPGVLYHLRYPFQALRLLRDLLPAGGILIVETATFTDTNRLPLLICPVGEDSPYEPTSCTFFNIKGFTDTARSLGFVVTVQRSLFYPPPYDPASTGPLPIDRTVFTCRRDPSLDDPVTMGYWDGDATAPTGPDWVHRSPRKPAKS
jgi:SAM-dependent methyltransferase